MLKPSIEILFMVPTTTTVVISHSYLHAWVMDRDEKRLYVSCVPVPNEWIDETKRVSLSMMEFAPFC